MSVSEKVYKKIVSKIYSGKMAAGAFTLLSAFVGTFALLLVSASTFTLLSSSAAYAQETSVIMGGQYVNGTGITELPPEILSQPDAGTAQLRPEDVALPEETLTAVIIEGGKNESSGELRMYKKEDSAGNTVWREMHSCKVMLGMGGLYKEKEGDNRTPVGIFRMNTPFGIKDPLPGFPEEYIKVDGTYYWNGDSESGEYNRLVSTAAAGAEHDPDFDREKSEHITDYRGYYDYCLNIGYNEECTPYRGSALFLHCEVDGQETHGCAAVPESCMAEILRNYVKDRTCMVIYDREAPQAILRS